MIFTNVFVRVIVSSIQTNRARCALYKKSLILKRKAFLEGAVIELVYKFDKKSYHKCLKGESISKVRFNFFLSTYILYIYMDTSPDNITPCSRMHMRGNKKEK